MRTEIYWDPFDVDIDVDPHPVWRRLRDEAPLYRNDELDFWALSRHADVETAHRIHQFRDCVVRVDDPVGGGSGWGNLQSLVEIGVDKNTTVVFPAPLMSTIEELGSFLAREKAAAIRAVPTVPDVVPVPSAVPVAGAVPVPDARPATPAAAANGAPVTGPALV